MNSDKQNDRTELSDWDKQGLAMGRSKLQAIITRLVEDAVEQSKDWADPEWQNQNSEDGELESDMDELGPAELYDDEDEDDDGEERLGVLEEEEGEDQYQGNEHQQ